MTIVRETIRSDLRKIVKGGATSRILDLHSIALRHGDDDDFTDRPFFENPRLNRSFVIKHTVRAHEQPYVTSSHPVVTKIVMPLARDELALGGHAIFVEEIGFAQKMRILFEQPDQPFQMDQDPQRLRELAALPSLDPFLLAERFANHDRPVDPIYFNITRDEIERMEDSVSSQVSAVVALAFGESGRGDARALRFTRQLLAGDLSGRLALLRDSLDMTDTEFQRGVFGWKGVLYYRWCMDEALTALKLFKQDLDAVSIIGASRAESTEIEHMRRRILEETRARWSNLTNVMSEYETVFHCFCSGQDAKGFRNFLLKAPTLFFNLGTDLSAVTHVPGYWSFWSRQNKKGYLHAREANRLFASFLASVTRRLTPAGETAETFSRYDSVIPMPTVFVPPAA